MSETALVRVLERYPHWPHVPRGASASQVARFSRAVLGGSTFFGWPSDEAPSAIAAVQPAPWDSEKLGVPSARIFLAVPPESTSGTEELLSRALASCDAAGLRYLVTRIDANDLGVLQNLEHAGFIVVDAILSQYLRPSQHRSSPPNSGAPGVRSAIPDDADALARISDACFSMSRFHSDPWVGRARARAIYADWARNIARGLNDMNLVAIVDGKAVGFLSCKDIPASRTAYGFGYGRIELVAMAPEAQGKGGVRAMTDRLVAESAHLGWDLLGIGTQIANLPAMRAYQKAGFVPGDSIFTLRRLVA